MSQEGGDSRRTGERAPEKTADDRGNGTCMSSQKLENVPKIHYYFHDTMTEICCFSAYWDIFFYTGERFRQREAENSNRRECTAAVWEKVQSEWKH